MTLRRVGCLVFCLHPRYRADSDKTPGSYGYSGVVALASLHVLLLGRVRKDNRAFLQQFKQLGAGDPHALDAIESEEEKAFEHSPVSMVLFGKHDHFQGSSLYHIYHAGVREVDLRLGRAVGAQTTLTPQAINTIRAALDAALVRETQKLNSQMVLLTIAIIGSSTPSASGHCEKFRAEHSGSECERERDRGR